MIKLNCKNCGIEFEKSDAEFKRQTSKGRNYFFCTLSCGTTYQRKCAEIKKINQYELNPKKCLNCNTNLLFSQKNYKTCSHVCGTKIAHLNGFSKKYTKHGKFKIKPCKVCGNDTKKIYCSKICESKSKRNITYEKLKNGEYIGNNNSSNSIRKALIQIRGHQCEDCKNVSWKNNPINLTLHHIDGNSDNNIIDNLQLLCWNCHSHTENYGRKNKNSARVYRYKKI